MIELDLADPNRDYMSLFDEYVEGQPFWLFRLGDSIFSTTVEDETIPLIVAGAECVTEEYDDEDEFKRILVKFFRNIKAIDVAGLIDSSNYSVRCSIDFQDMLLKDLFGEDFFRNNIVKIIEEDIRQRSSLESFKFEYVSVTDIRYGQARPQLA